MQVQLVRSAVIATLFATGLVVLAVPLCAATRCGPPPQPEPSIPGTEHAGRAPGGPTAPIVIATGRRLDYRLTSPDDGVLFDIDGDGEREMVAWTAASSAVAFLVLDRDGDGAITSGKEMFTDDSRADSRNGFEALVRTAMEMYGDAAGSITSRHPLFERLQLWIDANHNGISEPSELRSASDMFSAIGLHYRGYHGSDRFGNVFARSGWARTRTAPGRNDAANASEDLQRHHEIFDVYLRTAPAQ